MTGPVAASRSMNVLAPSDRIITTKIVALRRPYVRSSDGVTSGARTGPDGSWYMPWSIVTRLMLRRSTAVACAVLHNAARDDENRQAAGDRAGRRPPEREAEHRRDEQREPEPERADDAEDRRPQVRADAQHRLAAAVILDERARIEPGPAADRNAEVAIVGPSFVDLDRADRARSAQPVGELRQHALGRRPRARSRSDPPSRCRTAAESRARPRQATAGDRGSSARPTAAARSPAATGRRGSVREPSRAAG